MREKTYHFFIALERKGKEKRKDRCFAYCALSGPLSFFRFGIQAFKRNTVKRNARSVGIGSTMRIR
jgi:hypothetical protein